MEFYLTFVIKFIHYFPDESIKKGPIPNNGISPEFILILILLFRRM